MYLFSFQQVFSYFFGGGLPNTERCGHFQFLIVPDAEFVRIPNRYMWTGGWKCQKLYFNVREDFLEKKTKKCNLLILDLIVRQLV